MNLEKKMEKIFGDTQNEIWEGWNGSLIQHESNYYVSGTYVNVIENKKGVHINRFDSLFNLKSQNIIFYDSIDKRTFYSKR